VTDVYAVSIVTNASRKLLFGKFVSSMTYGWISVRLIFDT